MPYDPKELVHCEICDKEIKRSNISHHRKSKKHLGKEEGEKRYLPVWKKVFCVRFVTSILVDLTFLTIERAKNT